MSDTKMYRRHHAEIVKLVQAVQGLLAPGKLPEAAGAVRQKLSELAAKVKLHLAMEDGALYPSLMAHADPRVRDTASRFNTEMSNVKIVFETYNTKWTEAAIRRDSDAFAEESAKLFAALANRIHRENTQLYPLVENENLVGHYV